MAAILKLWRRVKNLSVDENLREERCCQISSDPIWTDRAVGFFEEIAATTRTKQQRQQQQQQQQQDG